jgi:hypothetical protein
MGLDNVDPTMRSKGSQFLTEKRRSAMDYREMTAPCGLDCFNCPVYLARDKAELREKIAANIGVPPERAFCDGCRPQGGAIACLGHTEPCNAYRCAEEKGVDFCCDCDDFPCDHLHPYADKAAQVPHNTKVFNLCLIKKMGLEKWAAEKAAAVKATYFKGKWKI